MVFERTQDGAEGARLRRLRRVTLTAYLAVLGLLLFGPHVCPEHGIVFKHPWQVVTPIAFSPGRFSLRDLVANVGAFFVLAVLMARAEVLPDGPRWKSVVAMVGFAVVLSGAAEWWQQYLPGRLPAIQDVLADAAGALAGAVAVTAVQRQPGGRRSEAPSDSATGRGPGSRRHKWRRRAERS